MTELEVGMHYAYRARKQDLLVEVCVLKIGAQRPPRVLVRFVDESFEGREEWVPPARLKVHWSDADEFVARETRWDTARAYCPGRDSPEVRAADVVFERVIDSEIAEMSWNSDSGIAEIHDPVRLAELAGLDTTGLAEHPASFTEDGKLVVPWLTTMLIATAAARLNPDRVLDYVESDEREQHIAAIKGKYLAGGRSDMYMRPEDCVEFDNGWGRPVRALLRVWCGSDATDRRDELIALRDEVARLGKLIEDSTATLRRLGHGQDADRIDHDLGVLVENSWQI